MGGLPTSRRKNHGFVFATSALRAAGAGACASEITKVFDYPTFNGFVCAFYDPRDTPKNADGAPRTPPPPHYSIGSVPSHRDPDIFSYSVQFLARRMLAVLGAEAQSEAITLETREDVQMDVEDFLSCGDASARKRFTPSHRSPLCLSPSATRIASWKISPPRVASRSAR